jgi:hypothetical protein
MIKGMLASALGVAALTCALAGPATADMPPTTVSNILDVAYNIRAQFAARYGANGKVGNDWCFNVDTERGYSWWYYKTGNEPLTAKKIRNTVRIQATYNLSDSARAYSSVFIGLLVDDRNTIITRNAFDLNYTPAKLPERAAMTKFTEPPQPAMPPGYQNVPLLDIPDVYSGSRCMTFEKFLFSYVLPNTALEVENQNVVLDAESGLGDYANARWWMFNGRGHQVFNVSTYSLKVRPENASPDDLRVKFTLVVGFGGGAGP